ncbi:hypothetical protein G6F68_018996 [Rhizopus microsporus]|nr:hypothetical protein G6F68_018996 [Rhizopus microsporus]
MAAQQLQQLGQAQRTRHQPTSALDATTCSPGGGARAASTSALAIRSAGLIRHARGNTGPNTPSTRRAKRSPRRTCCRCPPIRPGRTRKIAEPALAPAAEFSTKARAPWPRASCANASG